MAVSKSKRKNKRGKPRKGRRHLVRMACEKLERGGLSREDYERYRKIVTTDYERFRRGQEQMEWMLCLQSDTALLDPFLNAVYALERWPTTKDFDDFNIVSSSLMLGAICHQTIGDTNIENLEIMQQAAFMSVICVRLRLKNSALPQSNLDIVRDGLSVAQQLLEWSKENDRQALINVLRQNTREYLRSHPEMQEVHERLILGRNYETVQAWELADDECQKGELTLTIPEKVYESTRPKI